MQHRFTRRGMMAALLSSTATAAFANAPVRSLRPMSRPADDLKFAPLSRQTSAEMIAESALSGTVGFVIADVRSGEILEAIDGSEPLPPASVTKAVTALYAIESLGATHQFSTRLFADGPISDGVLNGNLILAGGGDPNLVTDELEILADRLAEAGLKTVTGAFHVWDGALPNLHEIDPEQLDFFGYNPAISGLNLNFNRVHFEWKRAGGTYTTTMDARSETQRPAVTMARMQIVNREVPVFTYADGDGVDEWTVARGALGNAGSRWLPVRYPERYAAEVFQTFARSRGIVLPSAVEIADMPDAVEIARFDSLPMRELMRDMLKFSTNLTAEAAGMAATMQRSGQQRGLRTSALGMTQWVKERAGVLATFADHSGLGDASRISADGMVRLLSAAGVEETLRPILKNIEMVDDDRRVVADYPADVRAKTGTLNFVSTLAGYIKTAGGRDLAFAIFAADMPARDRAKTSNEEQTSGADEFNRSAKKLQQKLLQRWGLVYGD